ncbi:hypothetical protein ACIPWF_00875 [Paenarthrobacter sp. NPDC089989]|uniref:hypothetical protein n=1 Tax=unclassified Paenarthrobacter TaxID=2634190 RepID=UPI0038056AB1
MTESVDNNDFALDPATADSRQRLREQLAYDVDYKLDMFLGLIFGPEGDNTDGQASITLVTPGGVIEGTLVHHDKYEQAQIDAMETRSETMARYMEMQREVVQKARAAIKAGDPKEHPTTTGFYHFLDATLTNGAHRVQLKNLRVSAKSVIAWSLDARVYNSDQV